MMALLPSPLQMFVLLRQPAKNLILMRLWKVVQGFSFWKMEPCSHPKWGFGKKKPKPWTPCTICGVFLCLAAFICITFSQQAPCRRTVTPPGGFWPQRVRLCHITATLKEAAYCPQESSSAALPCQCLLPNGFSFPGRAAADAFVDKKIRRLSPNI